MKIAIQANPNRGKEIISLLESLGGINNNGWIGDGDTETYYIDKYNKIQYYRAPIGYKVYTLEEFEKEFPFKVGDVVFHKGHKAIVEIFVPREKCYSIRYSNPPIDGIYYTKWTTATELKMKEERNITLTLEKAKEWYKKGGDLKQIALQAFSEKELTKVDLPKTWEEFCDSYPVKGSEAMIACDAKIIDCINIQGKRDYEFKDIMPSKKSAKAHLAMMQLEQLRDCWRQGTIPQIYKYKIKKIKNKYTVLYGATDAFLSFCDNQTAEEFLECFRDLIEKAGDLI